MLINGYNLSTEIASLLLCVLVLFLMYFTKPRKTEIYILDLLGFIFSVLYILVQQYIVIQTNNVESFNSVKFNITCFVFYQIYNVILTMIFMYIILVASNRKEMKPIAVKISITACVVFCIIAAYFCFTDQMYTIAEDGRIQLSVYFYLYLVFGLIDSVATFILSYLNRRNMAKVLYKVLCIFDTIEVMLLLFQMFHRQTFITSLTYVLPFIMFYLLFHSNPYDENSGCQNAHSFETRFAENVRFRRKNLIIYVTFPSLNSNMLDFTKEEVKQVVSQICRTAETIYPEIHLYAIKSETYAISINMKHAEKAEQIFNELYKLIDGRIRQYQSKTNIQYKMIGFCNNEYVKNMNELRFLTDFLFDKVKKENSQYFCREEDYIAFAEHYKILQALLDMRNNMKLDDARVLCYTQPIYNIQTKSFRTAEALMRLSLDGKTIYPDQFIDLAEEHDCIHALTCIMLNKVCENVKLLEREYDFEAITVNCSTSEFSNRNLHKELMDIIIKNQISPKRIRLELTESMMFDDYEAVLYNMNELRQQGIDFYLDDFGTGYSNLERIISCPFMTIKFDKSLLYKAVEDKNLNVLVMNMVNVFKQQGFILLMEGVENDYHRDYSMDCGFDYIQGYRYAKPVPVNQLNEYFCKSRKSA